MTVDSGRAPPADALPPLAPRATQAQGWGCRGAGGGTGHRGGPQAPGGKRSCGRPCTSEAPTLPGAAARAAPIPARAQEPVPLLPGRGRARETAAGLRGLLGLSAEEAQRAALWLLPSSLGPTPGGVPKPGTEDSGALVCGSLRPQSRADSGFLSGPRQAGMGTHVFL